jgi:hypothetical protein
MTRIHIYTHMRSHPRRRQAERNEGKERKGRKGRKKGEKRRNRCSPHELGSKPTLAVASATKRNEAAAVAVAVAVAAIGLLATHPHTERKKGETSKRIASQIRSRSCCCCCCCCCPTAHRRRRRRRCPRPPRIRRSRPLRSASRGTRCRSPPRGCAAGGGVCL